MSSTMSETLCTISTAAAARICGSPTGTSDMALWQANSVTGRKYLERPRNCHASRRLDFVAAGGGPRAEKRFELLELAIEPLGHDEAGGHLAG